MKKEVKNKLFKNRELEFVDEDYWTVHHFENCTFDNVHFIGSVHLNFTNCVFSNVSFSKFKATHGEFAKCTFKNRIKGFRIWHSIFYQCCLNDADFRFACLDESSFEQCSLLDTDLRGAHFCQVILVKTKIDGIKLHGTHLNGTFLNSLLPTAREGKLIGYIKEWYGIRQIFVPEDAERCSLTSGAYRCAYAFDVKGNLLTPFGNVYSNDRFDEYAPGIRFYLTKEEALEH